LGAGKARAGIAPVASTPYLTGLAMLRPTAMTRLSDRFCRAARPGYDGPTGLGTPRTAAAFKY
jgi:hypothetical protein